MELFFVVLALAAEFAASIVLALVLAFLVESLVEYVFGTPMDKIPKLQPYKWLLMYISMIAGILFCLFYKVDLVYVLTSIAAIVAGQPSPVSLSVPGTIVTGIAVGRGANYIHDFIKKHLPSKGSLPVG